MDSDGVVSPSKLWKTCPLTVMVDGHVAGLEGVRSVLEEIARGHDLEGRAGRVRSVEGLVDRL